MYRLKPGRLCDAGLSPRPNRFFSNVGGGEFLKMKSLSDLKS
jgi:hypothetical protein